MGLWGINEWIVDSSSCHIECSEISSIESTFYSYIVKYYVRSGYEKTKMAQCILCI